MPATPPPGRPGGHRDLKPITGPRGGTAGAVRRVPMINQEAAVSEAVFIDARRPPSARIGKRALKLLDAGALDEGDVVADRLGIGSRHLARLFRKHLGSSPSQVARSMGVQRAKRLIDETTLLMTEIAGRAGFNASLREVYRCAPSELRQGRRR